MNCPTRVLFVVPPSGGIRFAYRLKAELQTGRSISHWLLRALLFVFGGCFPSFVFAAVQMFNLPAQSAADALLAFSNQAGVEVLFPFEELKAVQSTPVTGRLDPEVALSRLLKDTGFYARVSSPGKFVVTRQMGPTGSIKGRVITTTGVPAKDTMVAVMDTRNTTQTDDNGEFTLQSIPAGTYRLRLTSEGYRPIEIVALRVEADRVVNLETQTLQAAENFVRLTPQVVEGRFFRRWKNRGGEDFHPQEAAGNIDLPRTENDALPYTIYDRDQIARSGVVNLNDFLQRNVLDSAANQRPPDQQPGSDSFGAGGSQPVLVASSSNLQLRGYGAEETAILVNGRRLPEVMTNGYSGATPQPPDVNFIPLSLVERVEVLPISSSALYTGNPVGGVINIVLRPDVNVTEVNATYTNALGGFDAPQSTVSLQHGETLLGGKLRVRLNASFTEATPANESELGYIQANDRPASLAPEALHRATPNVTSSDGSPLFGAGSASFTSVAPGASGNRGAAAFTGREGVRSVALFDTPAGLANSPNSLDYAYGRRQRGVNYFGSAVYDFTPWLQVGVDGIYNRTVINRGYNVFAGDLTLAKNSPLNPFGQSVDVALNETTPQLGPNFGEGRIDFYAAVVGVLVKLPSDWRVSVDSQYGHSLTHYRGIAKVDNEKWQKLVDDGIYNPLRDTQAYGPPSEFYDQALVYYGSKGNFVTLGDYQTLDTAVRVTNQSVPLPTGSGALNFGGDYRVNRLGGYTDEQRYGNGEYAKDPARWKGRIIERVSLFGELQAPLLPSKWLPHWIHEIETDLAARYVAAATAQETNVAPTAALKVDLARGFSLRGSVATANRFPPPFMSSKGATAAGPGGGDVSTIQIDDPRRDFETYDGVLASTAINPNLRIESNITRAAGLVYQHGKVHRVRVSVDFSDTRKSGEQVTLTPDSVLKLESSFPDRVIRAPLEPGDTHAVGRVTSLLTGPVNLAWRQSQNWTTSLDYAWTECFGGRLDLYGRWSYFSRYAIKVLPNDPIVDELNHPDGTVPVLKHRMNFGASWSKKDYGFGLDGHYYHSRALPVDDWQFQHNRQINPYWEFDAFVQSDLTRWLPRKFTRFALHGQLRVNNLFDARPPRYALDPSDAGVQSYGDWRRQTYALTLQATF